MLLGVGLGAAFSVAALVLFVTGTRLFPEQHHGRQTVYTGESRRRAEIRTYLRDIGERFVENYPVCGHSVAFYLPERDVAITFDAQVFFRIERTGAKAVLVEHELPGPLLGSRLPFETPDPKPTVDPEPPPDPVSTAFDILGIPPDADEATVRAAYREKVKTTHPDQGGDPEAFRRLRQAYSVAQTASTDANESGDR